MKEKNNKIILNTMMVLLIVFIILEFFRVLLFCSSFLNFNYLINIDYTILEIYPFIKLGAGLVFLIISLINRKTFTKSMALSNYIISATVLIDSLTITNGIVSYGLLFVFVLSIVYIVLIIMKKINIKENKLYYVLSLIFVILCLISCLFFIYMLIESLFVEEYDINE